MEKDTDTIVNLLDDYVSLQDRVYEILREQILSGKLAPNTPLNTNQLSKQMNVSRTPVRDAINKLVSVGLVTKVVHKEAVVADFMSEEMYEIFKARAALEGIAANSAARYMDDETKEKLVWTANRAEECSLTGDEAGFMEYDQEMHFLIYASMKTPILQDMAKQLYIVAKHNRATGYHIEGRQTQVLQEHSDIVSAIARGNADQAEKAGYQHLYNAITYMRKQFEKLKHQ